jgi:hypothetical protein
MRQNKGKKKAKQEEPTPDEQLEELYDQAMADIYDILMGAYDEVGVRVKELLDAASELDVEIEVELDDEDDYEDDDVDPYGLD